MQKIKLFNSNNQRLWSISENFEHTPKNIAMVILKSKMSELDRPFNDRGKVDYINDWVKGYAYQFGVKSILRVGNICDLIAFSLVHNDSLQILGENDNEVDTVYKKQVYDWIEKILQDSLKKIKSEALGEISKFRDKYEKPPH
ncbi:hypothetical protein [uncultured Eudoraea sp.]|uniref:hypothetical protein n=1 Tax=uncultured Eudoraea sp. TaxID=1035614 RepID=UPI0026398E6C|nr:hypothetical protein [uncultured Eudoraea sp.]